MKRNYYLLVLLLMISSLTFGQFENIITDVSFGDEHVDQVDSVTVYKEIELTLSGIDSVEFSKAHIDLFTLENERLISRVDFDISDGLNPYFSVSENEVKLTIAHFLPTVSYRLILRLTNYQGIESDLIEVELLKEE